MNYLLKNGCVVTEKGAEIFDILLKDGVIAAIENDLEDAEAERIDLTGKTVFAGLIDAHVHLREPGYEYKEEIETGARAAVAGGFTQIACMPNTNPVADNAAVVSFVKRQGEKAGYAKVLPFGAVTKGENGKELAEAGFMKEAGAVALSDDGRPVEDAGMMMRAMQYASAFGLKIHSHCEEKSISADGVVNEGYYSSLAGLKGISRAAEEIAVARDIILAETLGVPVHLCHISTKGSVELVREAKKRGVRVTAETCPHYFAATDEFILSYDSATKVNPPLRTEEDRRAMIEGLKDGTVDCIATDHAPHHQDDKNVEYNSAAFGISGLETAFSLAYDVLCKEEGLSLSELSKLMSSNPAKILNVAGGSLSVGAPADVTVADLNRAYKIDRSKFYSKGKNTPFDGREVTGKIVMTFVDGKKVFEEEV